jgi:NAD(P)-dependent dehydrogenase (short-subunit alcohol dehydrogenase family)
VLVAEGLPTASARARGRVADLDREAVRLAFDTKVIGPIMLAKHLALRMPQDGSFVFFSAPPRSSRRSEPWPWPPRTAPSTR